MSNCARNLIPYQSAKFNKSTTETVKGSSLSLQSVDDIQRSNSLSLCVLSVSNGISDDILKEGFKNSSNFLVDQSRDCLLYTSPSPRD